MSKLRVPLFVVVLLVLSAAPQTAVRAQVHTYYVAPEGSDSNRGTEEEPWQTISHAASTMRPGDTVLVKNGIYEEDVRIRQVGYPAGWTTFAAYPGHQPKVRGDWWGVFHVRDASYIEIRGFEVVGELSDRSEFSGNGILVADSHHVRILNNYVHDLGGGGIATLWSDYVHIESNIIHNTSFATTYGTSAISMLQSVNRVPDEPGVNNIIRGNIAFDNHNLLPFALDNDDDDDPAQDRITDGNCIIIDDSRHTQTMLRNTGEPPYTGQTLIENNLCYDNGGRGIIVYWSEHVLARHNTLYANLQSDDVRQSPIPTAELDATSSNNIYFYNNIVYALENARINNVRDSENVFFRNNLYYNSRRINVRGEGDIVGVDPQFVSPTTDPTFADFHLQPTSPAIDAALPDQMSETDLFGLPRPLGSAPDIGAFESG